MRSLFRELSMAVACATILAICGCSEDNEAFVKAQADANAATDKSPPPKAPQPKNQTEYFKQQQQSKTFTKSAGYPGAR